jgi:hypothetical protein
MKNLITKKIITVFAVTFAVLAMSVPAFAQWDVTSGGNYTGGWDVTSGGNYTGGWDVTSGGNYTGGWDTTSGGNSPSAYTGGWETVQYTAVPYNAVPYSSAKDRAIFVHNMKMIIQYHKNYLLFHLKTLEYQSQNILLQYFSLLDVIHTLMMRSQLLYKILFPN